MDRADLEVKLHEGKQDEIIRCFESADYFVTKTAIFQEIQSRELPARKIYDLFCDVLGFTSPPDYNPTKEDLQQVREPLKAVLPAEVVDASNSFTEGMPEYLDSNPVDSDALLEAVWDALKSRGRDDQTIGIGFAAFLYLSL